VVIRVITTDQKIWNTAAVVRELCHAMSQHAAIEINMINEGPDIRALGLEQIVLDCANQFGYDLSMLRVTEHDNLIINTVLNNEYWAPMQFVRNVQAQMNQLPTRPKQIVKHFGMFIGRSNAPRLNLSAYLYNKYRDQSIQTFHYTTKLDFHRKNLGLDELAHNSIEKINLQDIGQFLSAVPIMLDPVTYPILMDQHLRISDQYPDFFVEICCETYFSGETFFPTEKTWRAIANRTPFIIQGPQKHLKYLKDLGFQTFDHWWNEGYSEDPTEWQVREIKDVIDTIAEYDAKELTNMYAEMSAVLEHNYNRLQQLTMYDFEDLYDAQK
jgi:hypothetical protein